MTLLWILAAAAQCALLWALARHGRRIFSLRTATLSDTVPVTLPTAALIVPVAGTHPSMAAALHSLLRQDYPHYIPVFVTATDNDPAMPLVRALQAEFPHLRHSVAGRARHCGQKNHNLLAGIANIHQDADIFTFFDSTHPAPPDTLRRLIWPLITGQAQCSTGYHQVYAADTRPVTLAYQICVLLMRLLQAVAVFTQPWGGAMAITRTAYQEYGIEALWQRTVVDDCSLAALALKKKLRVALCPDVVLDTPAQKHTMPVWRAWMDRQVLFLKFCIPLQWYVLGIFAVWMALTPVISCFMLLGGLSNILPFAAAWLVFAALAHVLILAFTVLGWRSLTPNAAPARAWLTAFALAIGMFARVYADSIRAKGILWHGVYYTVGKGGVVHNIQ